MDTIAGFPCGGCTCLVTSSLSVSLSLKESLSLCLAGTERFEIPDEPPHNLCYVQFRTHTEVSNVQWLTPTTGTYGRRTRSTSFFPVRIGTAIQSHTRPYSRIASRTETVLLF